MWKVAFGNSLTMTGCGAFKPESVAESIILTTPGRVVGWPREKIVMMKIATVDALRQRRLVIEGKLVQPWVAELERCWKEAALGLNGRQIVIDLDQVTVISREGEDALLDLMKKGARLSGSGVFIKYVIEQMERRCAATNDHDEDPLDTGAYTTLPTSGNIQ